MIVERIKSLVYFLGCFAVVAFCIWGANEGFKDIRDLALNGQQGIGKVIDYRYSERRGGKGRLKRHHEHHVTYEENDRWIDLDKEYQVGTEFYVLYSKINPNNIELTKEKLSFHELYEKKVGLWGTLMIAGVILYFSYLAFFFFRQTIESNTAIKARLPKRMKINEKEMHDIRSRLKKPLKYATRIALVTFCGVLYFGFNKSEFPSLVTGASIVSLILFFIVYLVSYRGPKKV